MRICGMKWQLQQCAKSIWDGNKQQQSLLMTMTCHKERRRRSINHQAHVANMSFISIRFSTSSVCCFSFTWRMYVVQAKYVTTEKSASLVLIESFPNESGKSLKARWLWSWTGLRPNTYLDDDNDNIIITQHRAIKGEMENFILWLVNKKIQHVVWFVWPNIIWNK